ncbi:MAG: ATP-binding protein [bacterium]
MDIKVINELLTKATQGKLKIYDKNDFNNELSKVKENCRLQKIFEILYNVDVYQSRQELEKIIKQNFPDLQNPGLFNILLVFSEFATNMVKHGGGGKAEIFILPNQIFMHFSDKGKGIDIDKIPYIALSNYSTIQDSLGFGFTICIQLSDSIIMNTGPQGTNILVNIKL